MTHKFCFAKFIRVKSIVLGLFGLGCLVAVTMAQEHKDSYDQATSPAEVERYLRGISSRASSLVSPRSSDTPLGTQIAGEIFGIPVGMDNYFFAKRVADLFPRPWGAADLPQDEREDIIWEQLILHYESFRRGIEATEEELDGMINQLLKDQQRSFIRQTDPEAYRRWVMETIGEDPELLENQVRYLIQIRKLKDQILQAQAVSVTEEDLQQEFFNEKHHVGGEMVVFKTKEEAQAFYEHMKFQQWEAVKERKEHPVRPVSLMTLEAYIDLWGISKEEIYTFHGLELGEIGPPMPFGREWCVYRLLDKRTGNLQDFPQEREAYQKQVEMKKKYDALKRWVEQLKESASLKVYLPEK